MRRAGREAVDEIDDLLAGHVDADSDTLIAEDAGARVQNDVPQRDLQALDGVDDPADLPDPARIFIVIESRYADDVVNLMLFRTSILMRTLKLVRPDSANVSLAKRTSLYPA